MSKAFAADYLISGKSPQQLDSVPVALWKMEMVLRVRCLIGCWIFKAKDGSAGSKRGNKALVFSKEEV